jgi:hypothetical protein
MTRLNFLKIAAITACTLLVLSSCGDKEEPNETPFNQTVNADETTGKSGVTFVTSGAWTSTITEVSTKSTKSGTASWISISPDHGNAAGEYTIIISLLKNYTGEDRKATITISFDDMDITITVTQKGTGVSANDKYDEHEREMLIAFYKSTNGDNWVRKDNWCSDKPISQWYGVKTYEPHEWGAFKSILYRVEEINLPNNNLTGDAYLANFKSIRGLNILDGNKIESLTIDNYGNEPPIYDINHKHNIGFYHDHNFSNVHLKTLKISNTNGYIYANGNFSADTVIISDCNLSAQESIYFNLPSTKVGTLKVSNCTMGYFYADNSVIGNIIIDNCTFLKDEHGNRASIYVGNKTQVNNCRGLRSIYSSRNCSDLIVTNTVCDNIQCKADK